MLKETDNIPGQPSGEEGVRQQALVQIFGNDFRRNEDGSWTATKEIVVTGAAGGQVLIKEGKGFKKGELFIFGIDLAAILEKHCPQ